MILRITRYALLITILFGGSAYAIADYFDSTGNPLDTPTGTTLVAPGTLETLQYKSDGGHSQMPTAEASTVSHLVTSEYGFSGAIPLPDYSVKPGDTVYHNYRITVEGNCILPTNLRASFHPGNSATNWKVEFYRAAGGSTYSLIGTLEPDVATQETGLPVPDNVDFPYYFKVVVPSTTSEAPNGSYITITSTVDTASLPVGKYTGGNYFTYGGMGISYDAVTDQVEAPVLSLTRSSTVDAPKINNPVGYAGGIHDVVPGSIITYTLILGNSGSASAESVIVIDKVPPYTNAAHINKTGLMDNVNITAAQGNYYGWTVFTSTFESPSKDYGNTSDWSSGNQLYSTSDIYPPGTATVYYSTSGFQVKWIKWERGTMSPGISNATITWGVTVR